SCRSSPSRRDVLCSAHDLPRVRSTVSAKRFRRLLFFPIKDPDLPLCADSLRPKSTYSSVQRPSARTPLFMAKCALTVARAKPDGYIYLET
ncbi:unnamed protein product, partial [Trichogramma brassicae]